MILSSLLHIYIPPPSPPLLVFVSVNHPFNPHVYLKETLSKDDIEAISRGEIPRSVLLKLKKVFFPISFSSYFLI